MTPDLRAVIFDVDGTLADTERDGHRLAFNAAFAAHDIDISWGSQEYGCHLAITGGRRRIAHDLRSRGYGDAADGLAVELHATKTRLFRASVLAGAITARSGLPELIASLRAADIRIAIATTGRRTWVEPLIDRLLGEGVVEVMVTGDDVRRLKPDPEVYSSALAKLGLDPQDALAVEDSAVGLRAAVAAQLATIVVSNGYTVGQDFTGAASVREAFDGPVPLLVDECQRVHAAWRSARLTRGIPRGHSGTAAASR